MVSRSGHPFDSLCSLRASRSIGVLVFFAALYLVAVIPASAQSSINFGGGASIDPTQVYAGVSWQSPNIGGRFHLRPGIDGGFGNDLRLGTINIDFMVKIPLGTSAWSLIQGGGPTITIAKFTGPFDEREVHAGGSYLFGFQHDNGFFGEFRVGGGGHVPGLKMGAGWAVKIQ